MEIDERTKVYRQKYRCLLLAIGYTSFFVVVGVGSVVTALLNPDGSFPNPEKFALAFALGWGCWALAGLWMIATYFRHRLVIGSEFVTKQGCLFQKTIRNSEVTQAIVVHHPWGMRGVILGGDGLSLKINLGVYSEDEQKEIIEYVQSAFADRTEEDVMHRRRSLTFEGRERRLKQLSFLVVGVATLSWICWYFFRDRRILFLATFITVWAVLYLLLIRVKIKSRPEGPAE